MATTKAAVKHVLQGGSATVPQKNVIEPQYSLFLSDGRVYCETVYNGDREATYTDPPQRNDWELG